MNVSLSKHKYNNHIRVEYVLLFFIFYLFSLLVFSAACVCFCLSHMATVVLLIPENYVMFTSLDGISAERPKKYQTIIWRKLVGQKAFLVLLLRSSASIHKSKRT